ncbi:hypothetical protein FBU30_003950 [Linnemannia zychae]|nr:hypothetical protein FBU30_003950 [Linnemannia zychae]
MLRARNLVSCIPIQTWFGPNHGPTKVGNVGKRCFAVVFTIQDVQDDLEQARSSQVQDAAPFQELAYTKRTESELRPASLLHLQQANDMTKSIYKLLEDNARVKDGVSRQAQDSVSVANQSLEAFRQSQRRSSGTPISTSKAIATKVNQTQYKPQLRTTETEYDVSPSRATRLMTSPPPGSFVGTPSRREFQRPPTPGSMRPTPPYHPQLQDQQATVQTRPEDKVTLEWLQQTAAAEGFDRQRYARQESIEISEQQQEEEEEEHMDHYHTSHRRQENDSLDSSIQVESSAPQHHRSLGSPHRRRSNGHAEDTSSQKENIPLASEATIPLDSFLSRSTSYPKTPEASHSIIDAESSILEVAETTTTITNQLRGVYNNLQDFFSPETESRLQDAITAIGSQKANRVRKTLAMSATRPRPLEFRSASVRKDYRKPSSAPSSTRPLTIPQPFNFSERLSQIQSRRPSTSLSKSLGSSSAARITRTQGVNPPSTPITQNRNVNEYQNMSKSPFIPLTQRRKLLEESSLNTQPESTKRPLTIPKAPVLHTSTRPKTTVLSHDDRILQDIAQHGGYKANPIDKRIFESAGDYGLPKVAKPRLTVPKSPTITKRRPAPMRPAIMPSRSDPHHQNSHQQQQNKKHKEAASITERGLVSSAESARRLSQDKNRKSVTSQHQQHPTRKPSLTVPEPFSLATEARGERYQEQFKNKLTKWRQIEKESQFKALPLPTYPEVFVPKKSTKPLTHVEPIHLQTDRRAEEREAFDQERLRKAKIAQELLAAKAREDELRELRELKALRERLVPHPTPIKDYPRIEIHKSTRPLTTPRSPNIGQKRKRQMVMDSEKEQQTFESLRRSLQKDHQYQYQHLAQDQDHPHDQDIEALYQHEQYQHQEEHYVDIDPQEQLEREREQQRENERAREHEYERRRVSAFSNSRDENGNGGNRERQNRIREEIEQQREREEGHALECEERQLQAEREEYRRRSSSFRNHVSHGMDESRNERYENLREEYGQDKRQHVVRDNAPFALQTQPSIQYDSQLFARKMGRKSWILANDS